MYLGNLNMGMEKQANLKVFPKQAKFEISAFPPKIALTVTLLGRRKTIPKMP